MRIPSPTDAPRRIVDARKQPHFVLIQVLDPVNVFFSTQPNGWDLTRVDGAGNPTSGFIMSSLSQPLKIDTFVGEIWMRAPVVTEVEVDAVPI